MSKMSKKRKILTGTCAKCGREFTKFTWRTDYTVSMKCEVCGYSIEVPSLDAPKPKRKVNWLGV
jgi:Zn ribbon nucleic-acid-binding protein